MSRYGGYGLGLERRSSLLRPTYQARVIPTCHIQLQLVVGDGITKWLANSRHHGTSKYSDISSEAKHGCG